MGAIQNSINTALGVTAAASMAINKSDALQATVDTAKEHLKGLEADEAAARETAQTKIDEAALQSKLAETEITRPSESNKENLGKRIASAVDARKAEAAAKTARENLIKTQRLAIAARPTAKDLDKGGWLDKFRKSRAIINSNPVVSGEGGKK